MSPKIQQQLAQDDTARLRACGVTERTKLLVVRGASRDEASLVAAEAERSRRLERVKQAVEALAGRDSESG
jgi:predicted exporter